MVVPTVPGVVVHDAGTVFLNGSGQITHVVDGVGTTASKANGGKKDGRYDSEMMKAFAQLDDRTHAIVDTVSEVAKEAGRSEAQVALNWLRQRDAVARSPWPDRDRCRLAGLRANPEPPHCARPRLHHARHGSPGATAARFSRADQAVAPSAPRASRLRTACTRRRRPRGAHRCHVCLRHLGLGDRPSHEDPMACDHRRDTRWLPARPHGAPMAATPLIDRALAGRRAAVRP